MMRQAIGPRLSTAVLAVAIVFAAVPPPSRAAPADDQNGVAGKAATGLFIFNLNADQPADVTVELVNQADGRTFTLVKPGIAPLRSLSVYLPNEPSVPDGAYAASITSSGPVRVWSRTQWLTGGDSGVGNATVEDAAASQALILPAVSRDYSGQSSIITVQNSDLAASAGVAIEILADGQTTPAVTLTEMLPAGRSTTIDLDKDSRVGGLPAGFTGWARIFADRPVAASMLTHVKTETWPKGAHAWNAVRAGSGPATELHAPLAYNAFEGTTTGISILNPGPTPVDVTVRYAGVGGTCAGLAQVHGTTAVAAGGSAVFYQGDVNLPGTGRSRLPAGCAAAATIEATGGVVAVVVPANSERGSSTAYRALSAAEAGRRVALSPWRKDFYGNSTVHVVNPGTSDAQVSITFFSGFEAAPVACGAACQVTIPAGGAHRWAAADIAAFPDKQFGLAVIDSDQPVLGATIDTGAINADSAQIGLSVLPGNQRLVPLVLKNVEWYPAPTPQPGSETPTPGASPTPVPTPTGGTPGVGPGIFDQRGSTGIQIYNLSPSHAANFEVVYQSHDGGAPITLGRGGIPAGGTYTFFGPAEPQLRQGVFAATVRSTQPIDVLASHVWVSNSKGAYTDEAEPATDVILPVLTKRYLGQTSAIVIQNADPGASADIVLALNRATPGEPADAMRSRFVIPAGGATTLVLEGEPNFELPDNWQGAGRITASRPVAAAVFTDLDGNSAVYAYGGIPAEHVDDALRLPLVANAYATHQGASDPGAVTSAIAVHNPGSTPVEASVTYKASSAPFNSAACSGTIAHNGGQAATIDAGDTVTFFQGDVDMPVTGRSGLPAGCTASATVDASGPVAAVVNVAGAGGPQRAATYAGFGASQGARQVRFPFVRRSMAGRTTAIQVMNLGASPATAVLSATVGLLGKPFQRLACGPECTATIPPGGSHQWWPGAMAAFATGALGSASVTSDQPLAAIVHDIPNTPNMDTSIYRGYSGPGATTGLVPLAMNNGVMGSVEPLPNLPAPTPTPPPSLAALPGRMPRQTGDGITTPLQVSSYGNVVASLDLRLDYDARWLAFDTADGDGDGLPDAIVSRLPADFEVAVEHDAQAAGGEIGIRLTARDAAGAILPHGMWLDVRLRVLGEPPSGATGLGFSAGKAIHILDPAGRELPAGVAGGWRPTRQLAVFLPYARTFR